MSPRRRYFDGVAGLTQYPAGPHASACAEAVEGPIGRFAATAPGERPPTGPGPTAERLRHYEAGAMMARAGLARSRPDAGRTVDRTSAEDIVVLPGAYDRVQDVLDRLDLPYTMLPPAELAGTTLDPSQILIANCPGDVGTGIGEVRRFVAEGGTLLSTDWALDRLVAQAFPGTVEPTGGSTADAVVGVRPGCGTHPLLEGAFGRGDSARWWLEVGSYPIRVRWWSGVTVLLESGELRRRWGASPVAVLFGHGRGEVYHMISHFYLQRSDEAGARPGRSAREWAKQRGTRFRPGELEGITARQLESATSSARLLLNLIADKRVRVEEDRRAAG
ncbi:hypothetical protein [Pseudonocardia sp. ICBG1034]|uniref:hypothetical protein n=1 Tax=Pseudonocardia sp. ICBG1034 TaxID=2844381 RepID=UPI001CD03285|nr:hypothetical protein [Pseudonocardia sp. ICBG1034]